MTVYIFLATIILLFGINIRSYTDLNVKSRYVFFSFLLLSIVSGLRDYSVGVDTDTYVRLFINSNNVSVFNTRYEIGFIYYLRLIRHLTDNPHILLLLSSIVCIGAVCFFSFKESKYPAISLTLYITMGSYFGQMNTMRQALSLAITMIAFYYVLEHTEKKYIVLSAVLIFLSTLFHYISVLLYIPFFIFLQSRNKTYSAKRILIRAILFAIAGFIGYSLLMRLIVVVLPQYRHYLSGAWSDSNYNASLINSLIAIIFTATGAIVFRGQELNDKQKFAMIMGGFYIIFRVLSMRMEFWGRAASLFGIYSFVLWTPEFISGTRLNSNKKVLSIGLLFMSFIYMIVILTFRPEWSGVVPYRFAGF